MDKSDLPESFGVFKPVGHTLIAFASEEEMQFAAGRLLAQGFEETAFSRYTPEQMVAQVDAQTLAASPLASLGQELNLIQAHRGLAERGCSFLLVHAPEGALAEQVAEVARTGNAVAAQRYGRFLIEELIDTPAAPQQVFESPARGLDLPGADGAPR